MSARRVHMPICLMLLAFSVVSGCEEGVEHPEALGEVLRQHASAVETPVVTIDDRAVDVTQFRAFWTSKPDLSREEAVDAFVEQEMLYSIALAKGFAERKAVAVERKRAMVRTLLERTVEKDVTEETLKDAEIDQMVSQVEAGIGHPPGLRASHILVSVPPEKKKKNKGIDREAAYEQARAHVDEIRDMLPESPSPFDLLEAKRQASDRVEKPLSVVVNAHLRFPAAETEQSSLPEGWLNVVPEFREPAVQLALGGNYGTLSEPVRSPFGWHLIVVHEKLPGAKADPDAVREVAVARLLEQKRSEAVTERFEAWSQSSNTRAFPHVIEEAEELE